MMKKLIPFLFLLTACSSAKMAPEEKPVPAIESEAAQMQMCVEEHVGLFRFSRTYLEGFCPKLKTQFELTCMRFIHATKKWHEACPGIDTADKLECISTVANSTSMAQQESLLKCKEVKNRKQVFCLSRAISSTGGALLPERVQECLDKNLN